MPSREIYRTLKPDSDWAFFDLAFYGVSEARAASRALETESAETFWTTQISENSEERHPMLLPATHWLRHIISGPDWVSEFNAASSDASPSTGPVARFLKDKFSLSDTEPVYVVLMREHSYVTPWQIALSFWPGFLAMNDEGPFIFHADSGKFAHFGPNGFLGFGIKAGKVE